MQKVYNLLGVLGFVMSGTMAIGGVLFYTRVPSMAKKYVSELKLELTKTILDQVPVPEMPEIPKLRLRLVLRFRPCSKRIEPLSQCFACWVDLGHRTI